MRKNYIYLLFLFLFTTISFAQNVTITPTSVNGANVNEGPINLASVPYSSISLGVKVEIPDGAVVGDQGTIKIYYVNSTALGSNVVIGGDGGALYFGGGKISSRSFTINLNWGDFQTSGGYIYAEYKNSAGAAFRSSNLAVIKNSTMTSGTTLNPPADAPNPTKIANTLCCDQTVRLGEKPAPITGTTYLNPYQNEPYGINSTWAAVGLGSVRFISNDRSTLNIDHITELGKFTVTRSLGYNYGGQYPNKSNAVTITVVPSPIVPNVISSDTSIDSNGFIEVINTNPKSIYSSSEPRVNLNILQDPYHVPQRGDSFANIERYEWQYAKTNQNDSFTNKDWLTIPNENSSSLNYFTPENISNTEDNYFVIRRIAIYKDLKAVSNILRIIPRTVKNNNMICCDQVLAETSQQIEMPSIITGSTPSVENLEGKNVQITNTTYQWQSQAITNTRPNEYGAWTNITGAISKDYLPLPLQYIIDTRGGLLVKTTYNYRRIAIINYQINYSNGNITLGNSKSYSNEINIKSGRAYGAQTLFAYPNPASSIIYIENKGSNYILANTKISIANTMGAIVNSNNFSTINQNLISIDVSNLAIGTYFINIETGSGGRDNSGGKLTFIKNN